MYLSPKEIVDGYIKASESKANSPMGIIIGKSIMAGGMIAMGASASNVAAHGVTDVGLARLIAAVVFPVGLMMVVLLGAELFTGDCLMAMAIPRKNISAKDFCSVLCQVFLGNFIGSILLAVLICCSGQLNYSGGLLGAYTIKIAVGKVSLSPLQAVTSGICCNILVCAAVLMAMCAKDVTGKLMASFFVIMLFVTSGFEHCVANMYYITAGMLAKCNPVYAQVAMEKFSISATQLSQLNLGNMLLINLLPVTIGNILGGAVFVALPLYFLSGNTNWIKEKDKKEEVSRNVTLSGDYASSITR